MPSTSKVPIRHKKRRRPTSSQKSARASAPTARIQVTQRDRAAGRQFAKLVALQERLLSPTGCPWDREQTHASLRKYLIEETYEVLDAMQSGDSAEFCSELGDLLLQIIFHSALAETAKEFSISDVIDAIYTKMIRRHPHVFGDAKASTSKAVLKKWEELKAEERAEKKAHSTAKVEDESLLDGVPRALPAMLEAYQLTRRASRVGFDWESLQGIFDKLDEEKHELAEMVHPESASPSSTDRPENSPSNSARIEEEAGDLLFAAANVARFLGIDPEVALKSANRKFKSRFQWMERAAAREGRRFAALPRDRMEKLWEQAKLAPSPSRTPGASAQV